MFESERRQLQRLSERVKGLRFELEKWRTEEIAKRKKNPRGKGKGKQRKREQPK